MSRPDQGYSKVCGVEVRPLRVSGSTRPAHVKRKHIGHRDVLEPPWFVLVLETLAAYLVNVIANTVCWGVVHVA